MNLSSGQRASLSQLYGDKVTSDRLPQTALILDGATGTELVRRGFTLTTPLWSAAAITEAPELLEQIHRDYVQAGADIITANTFRTHGRNLREAGMESQAGELTQQAVDIARRTANSSMLIAGSVAPLEDCYSPDKTPGESELEDEHGRHTDNLKRSGVDLILVETQITIREGTIAARAARATGLPVLVSWTLKTAIGPPRLLSGELLQDALDSLAPLRIQGVLLNCIPAEEVLPAFQSVQGSDIWLKGAYANTGRLYADGSWGDTTATNPAVYAGYAQSWKCFGFHILGGCCGTTPEHVSLLKSISSDD